MHNQTPSPLRTARIAAGLSQEALARRVGCSTPSIRNAEHGMGSRDMRQRIADALGVEPETIWPETIP